MGKFVTMVRANSLNTFDSCRSVAICACPLWFPQGLGGFNLICAGLRMLSSNLSHVMDRASSYDQNCSITTEALTLAGKPRSINAVSDDCVAGSRDPHMSFSRAQPRDTSASS